MQFCGYQAGKVPSIYCLPSLRVFASSCLRVNDGSACFDDSPARQLLEVVERGGLPGIPGDGEAVEAEAVGEGLLATHQADVRYGFLRHLADVDGIGIRRPVAQDERAP